MAENEMMNTDTRIAMTLVVLLIITLLYIPEIIIKLKRMIVFIACRTTPVNFACGTSSSNAVETAPILSKYRACSSLDCVRCNKYVQVRTQAINKLHTFISSHGDSGLKKIIASLPRYVKELKHDKMVECSGKVNEDKNNGQNPTTYELPDLEARPWWDIIHIPDIQIVEESIDIIREEFENIGSLRHETNDQLSWTVNTTPAGKWCVFYLINQGQLVDRNCTLCPRTTKILCSLSSFMYNNLFGNAAFSVIFPQTAIEEHFGPTNIRLRCHIGLVTPNNCYLTVNGVSRSWKEGKCLLFDDSFLHSASHEGPEYRGYRAVLMLDLWHPAVSKTERAALNHIFSSTQRLHPR